MAHYESQRPGLGRESLDEIVCVITHIRHLPKAAPHMSKRTRRCRARRFPYGVIYQLQMDRIAIIAVMDLPRKPGYWRDRQT